ncbi:MAG: hypothetical protein QOK43_2490 [Acidimicrobiaceae bacterium]|nr:hypothetical protein [Acidimicrobiaceae bacterium]
MRALLNHIVAENLWVPPLVQGQSIADVGDRFDGDVLGDDPLGAYRASARAADAAFAAPGAMEAPIGVSYGPIPGEGFARHRLLDVVVHGWDLAKATGQDTAMDPDLADACWEIVDGEREMIVDTPYFGKPLDVGDDADTQTRLLALLGRHA